MINAAVESITLAYSFIFLIIDFTSTADNVSKQNEINSRHIDRLTRAYWLFEFNGKINV